MTSLKTKGASLIQAVNAKCATFGRTCKRLKEILIRSVD